MKRGPKPKGKVSTKWSVELAYAVGLLTADGCLSKDGRHINLTSKDLQQIKTFKKALGLKNKIGKKSRGGSFEKKYYVIQFGDVLFYKFLLDIGLTPAKSLTICSVSIADKYFWDFLRGYFDGDGYSYSFYDSVYKNNYRFYIGFASASLKYLEWLREYIYNTTGLSGHITKNLKRPSQMQLKYSKHAAISLAHKMYYSDTVLYLKRKHLKIKRTLRIINQSRGGETGRRAVFRTQ